MTYDQRRRDESRSTTPGDDQEAEFDGRQVGRRSSGRGGSSAGDIALALSDSRDRAPAAPWDQPVKADALDDHGRADEFDDVAGPDRGETLHAGRGATAAGAMPATAAPATRLAGPPQIDFGEVVVGERPTEARPIYNLHPSHLASVRVSLTGSDFALVSAPDRLRPSHEGSDAPVVIRYLPTKRSESKATLKIHAQWQEGAWPATDLEIPIVGKAYAAGEQSHAAEDAASAAAKEKVTTDADRHARDAQLDEGIARDQQINDPYPQAAANELQTEFERAKDKIDKVQQLQLAGITAAKDQAAAFKRKVPHADPGLLFTLAMYGIDMATAGLAGAISKHVSIALSKVIKTPAPPRLVRGRVVPAGQYDKPTLTRNSEEEVAFVADALKQGFKDAGKAGRKAALSGKSPAAEGSASDDARISFFSQQSAALADADDDRDAATNLSRDRLRPFLRSAPESAVECMRGIADGFEEMTDKALDEQHERSTFAWMRFLSQSTLGSLDGADAAKLGLAAGADGAPITDTRDAVAAPREGEAVERFDGVLDLEFEADFHNPTEPVKVVGARMNGVTPGMAELLRRKPLAELGVVIRAHGRAPMLANLPIMIVRDEAGNLRIADETGTTGAASSWLVRKGGGQGHSPERQLIGARKLMAEVMAVPLKDLEVKDGESSKPVLVKTDHAGAGR